jgi:hypothetical protein
LICIEEEKMLVSLDFDIGIIEMKHQPYLYVNSFCLSGLVSDIYRKDLFNISVAIVDISF